MPDRYWIPTANWAIWNATTSWSATKDGATGASVPVPGTDVVYLDRGVNQAVIRVRMTTSIGNISNIYVRAPGGVQGNGWLFSGTTDTTIGTTWTLTGTTNIDIDWRTYWQFRNIISGGGTINLTGGGTFATEGNATGAWGVINVNSTGSWLYFDQTNNRLGTGTLTFDGGGGVVKGPNFPGSTFTLANPIVANGDVGLNGYNATDGTTRGPLTLNGSFTVNGVRTITAGGSNSSNSVLIAGVFTATNGFAKRGTADLRIQNSASNVGGIVYCEEGSLVIGGYNSGTPDALAGATEFVLGRTGGSGHLFWWGSSAYTDSRPISCVDNNTSCIIGTNNTGGIRLTHPSVASFPGAFLIACDVSNSGKMRVDHLPVNASLFSMAAYSAGAITSAMQFHHSTGGTLPAPIYLSVNGLTTTGYIAIFEDNSTVATTFSGGLTHNSGSFSSASAVLTFRCAGTNALTELSGNITQVSGKGVIALQKQGTGTWTLSGSNAHAGAMTVSGGVLRAASATALGAAASTGVSITSPAQIELTAGSGAVYDKSGTTFTIHPSNPIVSIGNNELRTATITLSGTTTFNVGSDNSLTISPQGSSVIQGSIAGLTKTGAGTLDLGTAANTFGGAVTISEGTVVARLLANTNSNSSLGTGGASSASAIILSGTLRYVGSTASRTNRSITFTGPSPVLDASGTTAAATVTYDNCTQSLSGGDRLITFTGSNTGNNTLAGSLIDYLGTTSVAKTGAGRWVLATSGSLTYDGPTTISAGTLNLGDSVAGAHTLVGNVVISGGMLEHLNSVVSTSVSMTGGTIRTSLTGANTVAVTSGTGTLYPQEGNSYSGSTTVAGGATLRILSDAASFATAWASSGTNTGTGTATINGSVHTASSITTQKGQAKYGGLTFNSGSSLHIGAA